tara:strand:- start:117 stop:389 length:273 start_codon:yes stop_codon:yes gene_type:complete
MLKRGRGRPMIKNRVAIETLRNQLIHYYKKGIGEYSDLVPENRTLITPRLVLTILERYLELGGSLDFITGCDENDLLEYEEFIKDVKDAC